MNKKKKKSRTPSMLLLCQNVKSEEEKISIGEENKIIMHIMMMVQTSKTDHFFKLAAFRSPLTDLVDFGMAGKLLTSATRRCSPFVDSVSRI